MSDRLAEIERLREAAGIPTPMRVVSFPDDEYGGTWELHLEGDTSEVWGQDYATAYTAEIAAYLAALVNNADWLIARVRALEAQAERDGAIIDIVGGLVAPFAWTDAMDGDGEYSFSFGEMMVKAVEDGRALALENALAKRDADAEEE
jgi:hypothetical protein